MAHQAWPTLLYHYTGAQGFLGIIQSQAIWASNIRYLNDAQELDHAVKLAQQIILERAKETEGHREQEALTSLGTRLSTGGGAQVFVASFSAVGDSLSQWRGYCPSGAGYSIGFIAEDLCNEASRQRFHLAPCLYDETTQRERLKDVLTEVMTSARWLRALEEPSPDDSYPYQRAVDAWLDRFMPVAPTLKHRAFHDEQEWRLISTATWRGVDPRLQLRAGRSMLIPYVPIQLATTGSYMPIQEIIVGPTPHMDLVCRALGDWLMSQEIAEGAIQHNRGWAIRKSQVPYRDW
jgi:hypothetical protein